MIRPLRGKDALEIGELTRRRQRPMIEHKGIFPLKWWIQVAVPQITTTILLVHMAIGCCWHHGHACVTGGGRFARCAETPGCEATHSAHDECGVEWESPAHDNHSDHEHRCEGNRCTFVRSKQTLELEAAKTVRGCQPRRRGTCATCIPRSPITPISPQ